MNRIIFVVTSAAVLTLCAASATAQQTTAQQGAAPAPQGSTPTPQGATAVSRAPVATKEFSHRTYGPQGFSVVLVLGDMAAASTQDNVPGAARKALTDMKDFLPFKSYRLLDVQWTLCCGRSPVLSRLRGVDEQEYDLELSPSGTDNQGKLYVRFVLREAGGAESRSETRLEAEAEIVALTKQRQAMDAQLADLRTRYNDSHPSVVQARQRMTELSQQIETLRQRENAGGRRGMVPTARTRSVIDTSFTMDIGETVVVGTSRVKGAEKALIALLTAVPPRTTK